MIVLILVLFLSIIIFIILIIPYQVLFLIPLLKLHLLKVFQVISPLAIARLIEIVLEFLHFIG